MAIKENKIKTAGFRAGFTTFEFAIAFTAVGVIAALAVILISNSRMKLRDGRRLSDMIGLGQALLLYSDRYNEEGFKSLKCSKNTPAQVSLCLGRGPEGLADFIPNINFLDDPMGKSVCRFDPLSDQPGQACQPCNYAFVGNLEADRYNVAFCLEKGSQDLAVGLHYLTESGIR